MKPRRPLKKLTNNVDLAGREEDLEAEVKRDAGFDIGADVCDDGKAGVNGLRIPLALPSQSSGRNVEKRTMMMSAQTWAQALIVTRSLRLTMMPTLMMAVIATLMQAMIS